MQALKDQKLKELHYLNIFKQTPVGIQFYKDYSITDIYKAEEHPDFILKTASEKLIGIEVTELIVRNKNTQYSQALTSIGNKICKYAKKEYGIDISMLISQYDKRSFNTNWNDCMNRLYDPGFSNIPYIKEFKEELKRFVYINIGKLKKKPLVQDCIAIQNEYFKISIYTFYSINSGKFDCHINNAGKCKVNPTEELQDCINKKNNKFENYVKECDECYLLVILADSHKGGFCFYTNDLLAHKYTSKFKEIFLYDERKTLAYKLYTR